MGNAEVLFEREREFRDDVARRGLDAWVEPFGPDGKMVSAKAVRAGPDQIRAGMAPTFALEGLAIDWKPDLGALSDDGTLGFTTGPSLFAWTENGQERRHEGRYLTVWRRNAAGRYEIVVDCPLA